MMFLKKTYFQKSVIANLVKHYHISRTQEHGFVFENEIKRKIFNLPEERNNTSTHDIPRSKNIFDSSENVSLKTTGSSTLYLGDVLRFFNYSFDQKNTIIVVRYSQIGVVKIVDCVYEINYNKICHARLFGSCSLWELDSYVSFIKSIPKGAVCPAVKKEYKILKKFLQKKHNCSVQINPKVDNKTQRRVQCSIPFFEKVLRDFITYRSPKESPSLIRGKVITQFLVSPRRRRSRMN